MLEAHGPWLLTFAAGNKKILVFHRNLMLGPLDFSGSEHWAPFNFSYAVQPYRMIKKD